MLLRARWILPMSSEAIEDGAMVVRAGRIHDVGPGILVAGRHPGERVRDLGEAILLPGLVNVHAHLELTLLRGLLDDLTFFPWIRRLVEVKADGLKADEYVFYSLLGAAEMIRAGTTTVADCSDTGAPFDALALSGLRGIVFQEVFAPTAASLAHALPALEDRLEALQAMASDRVAVGISPHSTFMACDELLDATARIAADRSLPLSIHVAESPAEDAFIREGSGPIGDHHRARGFPVAARGCSPIEHVSERGWLALPVPVQLVHLAQASAADQDIVAAATRVGRKRLGLAACPRSNASLGNGFPDLAGWTRRGIPWGLGSDGAPSAGTCDLFSEMRFAHLAAKAVAGDAGAFDARSILARCTLEAARSLGMEESIGSIEIGKQADLCAVSLGAGRMQPVHDPHAAIVRCATPDDVVLTMVGGQILFDGKEISTIDEERVAARCRERARLLGSARPRKR
jgi:5-methylthioadenosine/S-adenosylhomocysteine deaminase